MTPLASLGQTLLANFGHLHLVCIGQGRLDNYTLWDPRAFLPTNGPRMKEMALGAVSCDSTNVCFVEQRDSILLPRRSQPRGPPGKPSLGRVSTPLPLPSRVLPWRNIITGRGLN